MDSNPLDALIADAESESPDFEDCNCSTEYWARTYGPRLLAVVKAARDECAGYSSDADTYRCGQLDAANSIENAMSTAAEVSHGQ